MTVTHLRYRPLSFPRRRKVLVDGSDRTAQGNVVVDGSRDPIANARMGKVNSVSCRDEVAGMLARHLAAATTAVQQ